MMRIVLIGNYKPDRQESMIRFAQMLHLGLQNAGVNSEIWWPEVKVGKGQENTNAGLGKWLGYIDKWVIFPLLLQKKVKSKAYKGKNIHFHICDHSNAPYLKNLPSTTSITCHDVLAIKGSMGCLETYTNASRFGKHLQQWILRHLRNAKFIACVSQFTLSELQGLVQGSKDSQQYWCVIHNAFNGDFKRCGQNESNALLAKAGLNPNIPFILHVGSGHARKNRKLLIDMVIALRNDWSGMVCFAGEAIEPDLIAYAQEKRMNERIISVVNPDHNLLTALYSSCEAFIFPSFSEGFGWPLIEAQACGASVIASNKDPMPEISGGAALHENPLDAQAFANALIQLRNPEVKEELITKGYHNCNRFKLQGIIKSYIRFYELSEKPDFVLENNLRR